MYLSVKSTDDKQLVVNINNITFFEGVDENYSKIYLQDGNVLDVKLDIEVVRQYMGVSL